MIRKPMGSRQKGGMDAPLSSPAMLDMDLNKILTVFWNSGMDMSEQRPQKPIPKTKPKKRKTE